MPASTTLLLIRHAHVENGGRICGWLDLPLSPTGERQLDNLRRRGISQAAPDALYYSPLRRASDTAAVLADLWGHTGVPDEALREIHCGALEGYEIAALEREYPDLWRRNLAQCDDDFTWPGGESYRGFRTRVLAAIHRLAHRHRGQRLAIVTHSGVITQVLNAIHQRPAAAWEHDRAAPMTLTTVCWNGTPVQVSGFSQICC